MNTIKILEDKIKQAGLDGFLVTNPVNIFYLSGFKGISQTERESILLFTPHPIVIVPRLYQNEAQKLESKSLKVIIVNERNQIVETVKELLANAKKAGLPTEALAKLGLPTEAFLTSEALAKEVAKVGFEEDNLRFSEYQELKKALPKTKLTPHKDLIEKLRTIKSEEEIQNIETAQIISQKAFDKLLKTIKPDQTEEEIAETLNKIIKSTGGHGLAFETIVASGPNAALPHYVTGNRKIKSGEVLLLDFGAKFNNYHADLSRTVFVGKSKDEHKRIFHHVLNAQKKAIENVSHGLKSHEAYHSANDVFKELNLHEFFLHGLGHGVGLEIHEAPYLRPSIEDPLEESMVFSIEPGLYFPEWGGIRIEDLVVIKNGKAKVIGKLTEGLIEI